MRTGRGFPSVLISARGTHRQRDGHPWVFDNEIESLGEGISDGELCDVLSDKGRYLGTGFYNSHSKIRVRIISRNANDDFSPDFYRRRLEYAWNYRKTVLESVSSCRVIFGEADQFPGLTADKYGDILVTETLCLGIERIKPMLFPMLARVIEEDGERISAIYERNESGLRQLEGMEPGKGFFPLLGEPPSTVTQITEHGLRFLVDFANGQKTGFFLDQRDNRRAAAKLAPGRNVLDCFTHTGAFGLNCAMQGAKHVLSVDISEDSLEIAKENAALNGLEGKVSYLCANVFDLLPTLKKGEFDYIILDPPAFTKSAKTLQNAIRGYKEINLRAMKALPRGGYLATCSCSRFMTEGIFRETLLDAAGDAGVSLRLIEARHQAADHPVLLGVPETEYLKFYLLQVF